MRGPTSRGAPASGRWEPGLELRSRAGRVEGRAPYRVHRRRDDVGAVVDRAGGVEQHHARVDVLKPAAPTPSPRLRAAASPSVRGNSCAADRCELTRTDDGVDRRARNGQELASASAGPRAQSYAVQHAGRQPSQDCRVARCAALPLGLGLCDSAATAESSSASISANADRIVASPVASVAAVQMTRHPRGPSLPDTSYGAIGRSATPPSSHRS